MKANQKHFRKLMGDRAEVGVGTLIVFIAMVLVAAVAAGVLINTSGSLQQRASQTGNEATQEVSSNLKVEGIYGHRAFSSAGAGALDASIDNLSIHLALQAGAVPIDLDQLIVRYSDGQSVREMNFSAAGSDFIYNNTWTSQFYVGELRDDDSSFSADGPVVTAGDLVKLEVYKVDLEPREVVVVTLLPEAGATVPANFITPSTYGTRQNVVIR